MTNVSLASSIQYILLLLLTNNFPSCIFDYVLLGLCDECIDSQRPWLLQNNEHHCHHHWCHNLDHIQELGTRVLWICETFPGLLEILRSFQDEIFSLIYLLSITQKFIIRGYSTVMKIHDVAKLLFLRLLSEKFSKISVVSGLKPRRHSTTKLSILQQRQTLSYCWAARWCILINISVILQ